MFCPYCDPCDPFKFLDFPINRISGFINLPDHHMISLDKKVPIYIDVKLYEYKYAHGNMNYKGVISAKAVLRRIHKLRLKTANSFEYLADMHTISTLLAVISSINFHLEITSLKGQWAFLKIDSCQNFNLVNYYPKLRPMLVRQTNEHLSSKFLSRCWFDYKQEKPTICKLS